MSGENLAAVAAEAAAGASKPQAGDKQKPGWATGENLTEPSGGGEGSPPQAPPAPQTPQQPAAAAGLTAADLDAARAEGRAAAHAYRNEIEELCALAGHPERARGFIDAEASVEDVRKQLLEARATADAGRQISTQIPAGGGTPEKGALAGRMKRLVGKEA